MGKCNKCGELHVSDITAGRCGAEEGVQDAMRETWKDAYRQGAEEMLERCIEAWYGSAEDERDFDAILRALPIETAISKTETPEHLRAALSVLALWSGDEDPHCEDVIAMQDYALAALGERLENKGGGDV